MTPGRRAAAARCSVAAACSPHLPELHRIVLRCVGDEAAADAVVHEVVGRVAADGSPPDVDLRRVLIRLTHDVLLERRRAERAGPP